MPASQIAGVLRLRTVKIPSLLVAATLLAASAAAQQDGGAAPAASDVFFDRLDVEVVNVEVYVTDKDGEGVRGLTAGDFEVFEDGAPQAITHFYAVESGAAVLPAPEAPGQAGGESVPRPPAEIRQEPLPEEQVLRLVVYFDNLHLRPTTRNKVILQVDRFVRRVVGPGDAVMLATFERSLHVRHPFTQDVDAFLRSLAEIEKVSGFGMRAATERREVIQRVERSDTAIEAESHIDFYAKSLHFDVSQSIKGMRELVGSLAGLPGRKALLYVSDGLPMTAAEDLYHLLDLKFFNDQFSGRMRASQYDARRPFRELTAAANANGVTIYTLEATGLRSHATLSAEYGSLGDRSFVEIDATHEFSLEEPLVLMAAETGGLAALNTNNIDGALDALARDLDDYYSLGYAPAHAVQGRYHEIEVRVKGKGLKVRHRQGYRDKVASTRVHEGTLASLLYGPQKNPLEIRLAFGKARLNDDGERLLPLEVHIPLARVGLVPHEQVYRGDLRVAVAVLDDDGRMSPVDQKEFPVTIPAADVDTARGKHYVYAVELLMRPGDHMIAVGVHDDFSGETSFIRQPIRTGT